MTYRQWNLICRFMWIVLEHMNRDAVKDGLWVKTEALKYEIGEYSLTETWKL